MSDENVKEKTCGVCRKDLDKQLEKVDTRLGHHDAEIVDLKLISEQLLVLQKQNTKIIEELQKKLEAKPEKDESSGFAKIAEQNWFKYIIITACIVTVLIVGAAIGQNALNDYLELIKSIGK
jgi:copper chaperone CopZ